MGDVVLYFFQHYILYWAAILAIIGILNYFVNKGEFDELNAQNDLIRKEGIGTIKLGPERINKVVSVTVLGGILGGLFQSPMLSLNLALKKANKNGFKVVQVIHADSGNVFLRIANMLLLVATLFMYTRESGYYLILERVEPENRFNPNTLAHSEKLELNRCQNCERQIQAGDHYCEHCGHKLSLRM